jgi:predicted alpha/beta-fold hydrolase
MIPPRQNLHFDDSSQFQSMSQRQRQHQRQHQRQRHPSPSLANADSDATSSSTATSHDLIAVADNNSLTQQQQQQHTGVEEEEENRTIIGEAADDVKLAALAPTPSPPMENIDARAAPITDIPFYATWGVVPTATSISSSTTTSKEIQLEVATAPTAVTTATTTSPIPTFTMLQSSADNNKDMVVVDLTMDVDVEFPLYDSSRIAATASTNNATRRTSPVLLSSTSLESSANSNSNTKKDVLVALVDVVEMVIQQVQVVPAPVVVLPESASRDHENSIVERDRAAKVSHSFSPRSFDPAWFARNPHFQTIMGVIQRQESMYANSVWDLLLSSVLSSSKRSQRSTNAANTTLSSFEWDERQRMQTPDGDFFDVDWKYSHSHSDDRIGRPSAEELRPLVLICHGLQSNSQSPLAKDMATAYNDIGMDAACINFRGCGGEINRTPFGYHLSFTDDLQIMVEHIKTQFPNKPIYLSGFSLGANVVTKFLSDLGNDAKRYNIHGAAVNAVPFDLMKIYKNLNEPGLSKTLYGNRLLKSLADRTKESLEVYHGDDMPMPFSLEKIDDCKLIIDLENLVICSLFPFTDAFDYYRKSSTIDILHQVAVPELVVQAMDDPFLLGNVCPQNDPASPLRIHYTEYGGHCGFVCQSNNDKNYQTGWMPTELARFLYHVENNRRGIVVEEEETIITTSDRVSATHSRPLYFSLFGKSSVSRTPEETEKRRLAAEITQSFQAREFRPSFYATNSHLQTILGVFSRDEMKYTGSGVGALFLSLIWNNDKSGTVASFEWDERQRMETPDGDFFDVDWKFSDSDDRIGRTEEEAPLVLICHGLQSNSGSPLVKDMATAYNRIGMDAACLNFRGCGGEINRTPRSYHVGFTDDLKLMIADVNSKFPNKPIYLSGFSLGSNVVTKFLADIGPDAEKYNIWGAAVNALPMDMTKTWKNINEPGVSKRLYGDRLLQSMIERVEESYDKIAFPFPKEKARACKTILDMENIVIAPVFGFDNAHDYYEKMKTVNILDRVEVPQFVVQALDDPFFQGAQNPETDSSMPLRIHYTQHGGHCGYVFHSQEESDYTTSWMPTEMARFLNHVHTKRTQSLMASEGNQAGSLLSTYVEEETTPTQR